MQIIIRKIKYRAMARFWTALEDQPQKKYLLDNFEIPKSIIKPVKSLPKNMPLFKNLSKPQQEIVRSMNDIFDNLWKKYQKDINKTLKKLQTTDFKMPWLKKEIPKATKVNWPFKKVYIFPGIMNFARVSNNQICIGIRPKYLLKKYNLVPALIHELIHVNTWEVKFKKKLFFKKDATEITTDLLANKIIRKMNNVFHTHIPELKFATLFTKLEKYRPEFEKISNQSGSYKELIFKVDKFLHKIKYLPHYLN